MHCDVCLSNSVSTCLADDTFNRRSTNRAGAETLAAIVLANELVKTTETLCGIVPNLARRGIPSRLHVYPAHVKVVADVVTKAADDLGKSAIHNVFQCWLVWRRPLLDILDERSDHIFRQQRRHVAPSPHDIAQGTDQFRGRRILDQVSGGSELKSFCGDVRVIVHREINQPDSRHQLLEALAGEQAVHVRHPDINNSDIGHKLRRCLHQRQAVGEDADNFKLGLKQIFQSLQHYGLIICEYYARAFHDFARCCNDSILVLSGSRMKYGTVLSKILELTW